MPVDVFDWVGTSLVDLFRERADSDDDDGPFAHADDLDMTQDDVLGYYFDASAPEPLMPKEPLVREIEEAPFDALLRNLLIAVVGMMIQMRKDLFPTVVVPLSPPSEDIETMARDIDRILEILEYCLLDKLMRIRQAFAQRPSWRSLNTEEKMLSIAKWEDIVDTARSCRVSTTLFRYFGHFYSYHVYTPFLQILHRRPEHPYAVLEQVLDPIRTNLNAEAFAVDTLEGHILAIEDQYAMAITGQHRAQAQSSARPTPSRASFDAGTSDAGTAPSAVAAAAPAAAGPLLGPSAGLSGGGGGGGAVAAAAAAACPTVAETSAGTSSGISAATSAGDSGETFAGTSPGAFAGTSAGTSTVASIAVPSAGRSAAESSTSTDAAPTRHRHKKSRSLPTLPLLRSNDGQPRLEPERLARSATTQRHFEV